MQEELTRLFFLFVVNLIVFAPFVLAAIIYHKFKMRDDDEKTDN